MADNALYIGWNRPKLGRESLASEMFTSMLSFLQEQVNADIIESYEPVLLAPHGGDLNGFILVRGDATKLSTLRHSDTFMNLVTQCLHCVDNFGVIDGYVGNGLTSQFERWNKLINNG